MATLLTVISENGWHARLGHEKYWQALQNIQVYNYDYYHYTHETHGLVPEM